VLVQWQGHSSAAALKCALRMHMQTPPGLTELQVHIDDYSQPVAQPALGGKLCKAGDDALVLSEDELIAVGWRAHTLQQALLVEGVYNAWCVHADQLCNSPVGHNTTGCISAI
jgi:hypothetical protein